MNLMWLLLIVPVSIGCGVGAVITYALLGEAHDDTMWFD